MFALLPKSSLRAAASRSYRSVPIAIANATRWISTGDKIPTDIPLFENSPGDKISLSNELTTKSLIIGVPGAFSPTCTDSTVTKYVSSLPKFISHGFSKLIFVSVNDAFVMHAWKESFGAAFGGSNGAGGLFTADSNNITFLADPKGEFVGALDLLFDAEAFFGNKRSKRFCLAVDENGRVLKEFIEPDNVSSVVTEPSNVLKHLSGLD